MQVLGAPSDRIAVEFGGRRYGVDPRAMPLNQKFSQDVPEVFRELAVKLRAQSVLAALKATSDITKRAVFAAYATDLALLKRHLVEFETCMKYAVRCSIIAERGMNEWNVGDKVDKTWATLKGQIPQIGKAPLIELPHTRAAKPALELLAELKVEFEHGVNRMLQLFAYWLQTLVEQDFVGLVEWTDLDVCRYHYFRHEQQERVVDEKTRHQPHSEGGTESVRDRTIQRTQFSERHVHHIVDAKLYRLDEYHERVPDRIRNFIEAVPDWLRSLLQIVDGQITMEEFLRKKTGETTHVESEVTAVYKYSPGVLLGAFNLIGWSAADLGESTGFISKMAPGRRKIIMRRVCIGAGIAALIIAVVIGITLLIKHDMDTKAEAHATYVNQFASQMVMETKKGQRMDLPVIARPVYFSGKSFVNGTVISFTMPSGVKSQVIPQHGLVLGDDRFHQYRLNEGYGGVDLGPDFGVFVRLHVFSVTEDAIRYAAERYGD